MRTIDLDALKATDIPIILEAMQRYFLDHGLHVITDNVFMRPETLAKRWELSISCLNNWRFTGGGPLYMKTGPGPKAKVRYPMLGRHGVLDFEQQHLFRSTTQDRSTASSHEHIETSIEKSPDNADK
jgi:hypothetical protein